MTLLRLLRLRLLLRLLLVYTLAPALTLTLSTYILKSERYIKASTSPPVVFLSSCLGFFFVKVVFLVLC